MEFGWRFNPAELRNEHGEWTKLGEVLDEAGKDYEQPDHARLVTRLGRPPDPADHPFFKEHPVSAANVVASYDRTDPGMRQQGLRWYADAHVIAKALAHGDAEKGAGVLAAYSPQTGWPANMMNAARSLEMGRAIGPGEGMITGAMQANAQKAMDGAAADVANSSPKTRAFARLIRNGGDMPGDTEGDVVIDRHAMTVAMGQRLPKKVADNAPIGNKRYYDYVADQYREAARQISERDGTPVAPHQLQAITWLQQQEENEAADAAADTNLDRGRATANRNAWISWDQLAAKEQIPTYPGTTQMDATPNLISQQVIDLGFNPLELRGKDGRWYHGTNAELAPGDKVLTGKQAGRGTRGGPGDDEHAWVSSDPYRAGAYGAHIYEVEPSEQPKHTRGSADEYQVSGARVVREVPYDEARQLSPSYQAQARAYARSKDVQAANLISQQVMEFALGGWHDAWMHELRGPHGEWVRGTEALSDVGKARAAAQMRDAFDKQIDATTDPDVRNALFEAKDYATLGELDTARLKLNKAIGYANVNHVDTKPLLALRDQIDKLNPPPTIASIDKASAAAADKLIKMAADDLPGMFGDNEHLAWDGKPPTLFAPGTRPSRQGTLLATVDWKGHMDMLSTVADGLAADEKHPGQPIADASNYTVPLHELIHAVIPASQRDRESNGDADAYQDYATAQIEEGFTELGTIQHAGDFFDQIGVSDRRVLDSGSLDKQRHLAEVNGEAFKPDTTASKTMGELADSKNNADAILNGEAWGHYPDETAQAYSWVSMIAQMRTGKGEGSKVTRDKILEIADEVNAEGAAGKITVMARHVAGDISSDPKVLKQILPGVEDSIRADWGGTGGDVQAVYQHARLKAQQRAAEIEAERSVAA